LKATKKNLQKGEIVVICDFLENYAFIVQNSIQAYYWSNNQASLHPFVCYYKLNGEEHHFCFVVILNIMHHDTIAVYLYQTMFINHLKTKLPNTKKKFYFTDGAPSQYIKIGKIPLISATTTLIFTLKLSGIISRPPMAKVHVMELVEPSNVWQQKHHFNMLVSHSLIQRSNFFLGPNQTLKEPVLDSPQHLSMRKSAKNWNLGFAI
jgi:hypothetical protein